ncbi:MAG TPA: MFS transporter [Planktothrix sp.]|jgi:MFS family permease
MTGGNVIAALKNRNLQLYFGGQVISQVGTWMQQMALSWLIYRLTGSTVMLGVIGFTSQAPSLFLSPFAGIVADRVNRHRLYMITQTLCMVQAAMLTLTVWFQHAQVWQLVALSAVLGVISAFDIPTRQAFLPDMLNDKEELTSAVGLNSSITTLTRLIGPFVAGIAVSAIGEKSCFLANALSYLAVIITMLFVHSKQKPARAVKQSAWVQLKEGYNYTIGFAQVRDLILLLAVVGFVVMPITVLMPAFARDVFHGDAMTLGYLTASSAIGSTISALFLASRRGTQQLSRWIMFGCGVAGMALMVLGLSHSLYLSLLASTIVGLGTMMVMAGSMTVIQTIVDESKRGRVMSFVVMAFLGLSPFGCIGAGALANKIGAGATTVLTGFLTLLTASIFAKRILKLHQKATPMQVQEAVAETQEELAAA